MMRRFLMCLAVLAAGLGSAHIARAQGAPIGTTAIGVRVFHDVCVRSFLQTQTFREYLQGKFEVAPTELAARVRTALKASGNTMVYVLTGVNASYALALDPEKTACYLASPLTESYPVMKDEFAKMGAEMGKAGFEIKDLGEAESKTTSTIKRSYGFEGLNWYVTGAVSKLPPGPGHLPLVMAMTLQKPDGAQPGR